MSHADCASVPESNATPRLFLAAGDTVKFDGEVQAVYTSAGWAPVEGSRRELREAIWSLDNNAPADALAREANRRLSGGASNELR